MLPLLQRLGRALLYDEAAAQRWAAALAGYLAVFLATGGVVPGTATAIPLGDWGPFAQKIGTLLVGVIMFITAGGKLPAATPKP